MWTERARSWRKKGKRAVSPIIATILLVAITVVLAAVLYILISGLTKGPGNTPLGTAFAWGPGNNVTGTVASGCTAGHDCYSMEIASASSGIQASGLSFSLRTTAGAAAAFSATAKVTLVGVNGAATTAVWTAATNSWASGNTVLVSGETLVIDNGNTAGGAPTGSGLYGYTVVAVGQGSFQGEVASSSLS